MAEETFDFEQEVFTLTDEEGKESDFEFIGRIELDGNTYVALIPVEGDEEEYVNLSDEDYYKMIDQKIAETEFVKAIVIYVG